ncbi:hypothetical protein HAX54_020444 [Datura stramonium]|uniref:Uncharacterized protein n=1 Tax=Datura stramonium TaxID=4076 RepID=A0ABS8Y510_DATST|nr:hypothetical protein [Datura stramonium]
MSPRSCYSPSRWNDASKYFSDPGDGGWSDSIHSNTITTSISFTASSGDSIASESPRDFDTIPKLVGPQIFIDRCGKMLTTQGLLDTHEIDFIVLQFSGLANSWSRTLINTWRANLSPLTWA